MGRTQQDHLPSDTAVRAIRWRFTLLSGVQSNPKGEENLSPIKKLCPTRRPRSKAPQVNLDDKIELVGWWVEPEFPKPGSTMTTHLIFRSLVIILN